MVSGPVGSRERVRVGPQPFDDLVVNLRGVLFGATEHHVLKEMSVAREALLHFVSRSGAHHRVVRHDAWAVVVHPDDLQPVAQLEDTHGKGKNLLLPSRRSSS